MCPECYNCRELLPDNYNCRELLCDIYNSRDLRPDSYNCHELLPDSYFIANSSFQSFLEIKYCCNSSLTLTQSDRSKLLPSPRLTLFDDRIMPNTQILALWFKKIFKKNYIF